MDTYSRRSPRCCPVIILIITAMVSKTAVEAFRCRSEVVNVKIEATFLDAENCTFQGGGWAQISNANNKSYSNVTVRGCTFASAARLSLDRGFFHSVTVENTRFQGERDQFTLFGVAIVWLTVRNIKNLHLTGQYNTLSAVEFSDVTTAPWAAYGVQVGFFP